MNCLRIAFCTLIATIALFAAPSLESLKQAESLYLQGLQAQKDNDLKAAREAWEQAANIYGEMLASPDFDNARLRYNLGNVYLAQNQLGLAIHNYRKAMAMAPDTPNVEDNLQLARERRKDQLKQPEGDRLLKTLFAFHYELSKETRQVIFYLAYAAFFGILILRLLTRKHTAITVSLILTAILALISTVSLAVTWSQQDQTCGVITAKVVHAKSGSSNSYQDAFEAPLHDGTEFVLIGKDESAQWLHVRLENDQTCWIPAHAAIF